MMKVEFQFEDVVAFSKFIMNTSRFFEVQSNENVVMVGNKYETPQNPYAQKTNKISDKADEILKEIENNEKPITKKEHVKPIIVPKVRAELLEKKEPSIDTLDDVKIEKQGRSLNIIGMDKVYEYYIHNTKASQGEIARKINMPQTTLLSKLQAYVKEHGLEEEYERVVKLKAKPRTKKTATL